MANFESCGVFNSSPESNFDFEASPADESCQGQEFTLEIFIEEVRSRPIIWNSSLRVYKDSRQKEVAWEQIGKIFQKNGKFSFKFSALQSSITTRLIDWCMVL